MDIDPDRWQALLTALRNAIDSSPPFMLLQEAQGRWARARADLEAFEARGAVGRRDQRNPDLEAAYERSVAELKQREAAAEREVQRISALQQQSNARRRELQQQVDGVREWAKAQSPPVMLPGDDDTVRVPGFAASSVHIAPPPPSARAWP